MPVCIAGMHRSGTSMVAKLLHSCGVYLGQERDLMPPGPHNLDGYWENVKFVELNDEILNELGGGWDRPPSMPDKWNEKENFSYLNVKAKATIQEFSNHEPWGWKDPRNSLTLPFWMTLLPDLKITICLRNPIEVALSLHRVGWSSYSLGLHLWEVYNQRVLELAAPAHRIVTHYDAYFADPRAELRRLLSFLNLPLREEDIEGCCSAVRADLHHQRFSTQHLLDADVSPEIFKMYMRMCDEAGWADLTSAQRSPVVNSSGSDIGRRLPEGEGTRTHGFDHERRQEAIVVVEQKGRQLDKSVIDLELLRREVEALRLERAAHDNRIRELQARLEEQAISAKRLAEAVTARDATISELQATLDEREAVQCQTTEILRAIENQTYRIDALAAKVALLSRAEDEVQDSIDDLQAALVAKGFVPSKDIAYRQLIRRIREVVRNTLPPEATVIVASKGDSELLKLERRKAWHFPRTEDGAYAGYYPASSTAAIAHLEALRAKGGDFFLLPSTALWWLDHYAAFRGHLERTYRLIHRSDDTCVIFTLGESSPWLQVAELIAGFKTRHRRCPAILNWESGFDLAKTFPECAVFAPLEPGNNELPYLEKSIDIVAVRSGEPDRMDEARRVASEAVLIVGSGAGDQSNPEITIEARRNGMANTPQTRSARGCRAASMENGVS